MGRKDREIKNILSRDPQLKNTPRVRYVAVFVKFIQSLSDVSELQTPSIYELFSLSLSQRWCLVVQVFYQHERHRDVRRQRHVVVDDDLSQLVRHQRQVFSIRRTELYDAVRFVDLRWISGSKS